MCAAIPTSVFTELEITNLEKKMMMTTTNPLMHRKGVTTSVGGLGSPDACNTRQFCLETLRVFEKETRVKNQRTAHHFRSSKTKFIIKSELPSPGV